MNNIGLRVLTAHEKQDDPLLASEEGQQLLDIYSSYYAENGFQLPWVAYLIVRDNQLLGTCGFVTAPQDNQVEIAYWIFKDFENQGIASFACQALVEIGQKSNPSLIITAKTAPEKNASTRILEKNGFTFERVVQDHEIGDAWLWVLPPSQESW